MANYYTRRVLFLILVIWSAASINWLLPHLSSRDPIREQMTLQVATQGRRGDDALLMEKNLKSLFGLDQPIWKQYFIYLGNTIRGNFGYSLNEYPRTVGSILKERGRLTIPFVAIAILISFLIGIFLGAFLGWNRTPKWVSTVVVPPLLIFSSVPQFLIALVLIYFVAFRAKLLPMGQPYPLSIQENWTDIEFLLGYAKHAILPILTIVLVEASGWALGMRAMMVTVEGEDYATFAEAKGLKTGRIFVRYLMRNAMLPMFTSLALRVGFIITGAAIAETYFNYNGIGQTLGAAITSFNYFVIYGIVIFMVLMIALMTFLMDLIYPLLDPRITYKAQRG
jgi:peptide/nickel transport system permease protein